MWAHGVDGKKSSPAEGKPIEATGFLHMQDKVRAGHCLWIDKCKRRDSFILAEAELCKWY